VDSTFYSTVSMLRTMEPMAAESAAQQLGKEDQINERTFNEAIWQSVKGAGSVMPEPQHRLDSHAPEGADADGDGE
jgi:hypothetical protein